jgi:hypothetical protein
VADIKRDDVEKHGDFGPIMAFSGPKRAIVGKLHAWVNNGLLSPQDGYFLKVIVYISKR